MGGGVSLEIGPFLSLVGDHNSKVRSVAARQSNILVVSPERIDPQP